MSIHGIEVKDIKGNRHKLDEYEGKLLLIVNTASKCGFTPQFEGLQKLYDEYRERGLEILGFPCNQFLSQDPGSNDEIESFCQLNYGVTFPMFAKISVNGPDTHPLFEQLKSEAKGLLGSEAIKWNFTKFLVSPQGKVLGRYPPNTTPKSMRSDIEKHLPKS